MVASHDRLGFRIAGAHRQTSGCRLACPCRWPIFAAVLLLTGCFSGDYNRRMDESMKQLGDLGEKANAIYPTTSPVQDAGGTATGINLKLPQFISGSLTALRATEAGAQPPFMQLPGLSYTYAPQVQEQPAYAYFAAVAVAEKGADVLEQEVQAAVAAAFSGAAWTEETLSTPTGGSITLKRISVTGNQAFGDKKEDGRFDLYLIPSATHTVLIGWRAPISATTFFQHATISMGSVEGKS